MIKKTIVYILIAVLVLNIVLFALRLYSWLIFWAVIIVGAIVSYILKKQE